MLATIVALLAATVGPSFAAAPPATAPVATAAPTPKSDGGHPVKVLMVGDSTALTLAIGLSEHESSYGVQLFNGGILGCGVTSGKEYQLKGVDSPMVVQCSGSPARLQWPQVWKANIAKTHPNVVMILAGRWEVSNRTYEGHWTDIENPTYAAYVKQQLRHAVRVAASGGARVVLMTAPCYDSGEQPDGEPWPEDSRARLSIYNRLVRQVAATSPNTSLLNFNAMACPGGHYEEYLDGQQVRQADGIHFTFDGGNVFASRILPVAAAALGRRQPAAAHAG